MFFRMLTVSALLIVSLPAMAQISSSKSNNPPGQSQCPSQNCLNGSRFAADTSLPAVPVESKWQVEDFKHTDASVSCAVVKYDPKATQPTVHLLCPGPNIFAPLRVHLALTWKRVSQIPSVMKNMLVDMSRAVKFKSKPGDSRAELTFYTPQMTGTTTKWVRFTEVSVGLVLPPK